MAIRLLELSGTNYEMGFRHGELYKDSIQNFAEERVRLSGEATWTGQGLSRSEVLALAEACLDEHKIYCPDLYEELQGMADATGLSLSELLIVNGFTDFIDVVYNVKNLKKKMPAATADNCTSFLVPNNRSENSQGFCGQTWDMHKAATPHVVLIDGKPKDKPNFLAFTSMGCVGMIGMNDEGISVGINNLLGADGQIGVMWVFVIRKILEQRTLEEAIKCIANAPLAGAHNFLLFDKEGNGFNIEAMSTKMHIEELKEDPIVHTNHCVWDETKALERTRAPDSQASSVARLSTGQDLLEKDTIDVEDLKSLTRNETICVRPTAPSYVESCGAAIMRPSTGDFWAVWGLPDENEYEHFSL